jgi:hypothetical protein
MSIFAPTYGETKSLSATSSSSEVTIITGQHFLHITNAGPNAVFIRTGSGSQTATTGDFPLLENCSATIKIGPKHDKVAGICLSGETATVYVNPGPAKA